MLTINKNPSNIIIYTKDLYVGNTETIIIEANTLGYHSFGLSITNDAGSTLNSVNIYASADDINYYTIQLNAITSVVSGNTSQYAFDFVNRYVRITATSAGSSTIDCYLIGVP